MVQTVQSTESLSGQSPPSFEYERLTDPWWHDILSNAEIEAIAAWIHETEQPADEGTFARVCGLLLNGIMRPARLGISLDIVNRLAPYRQKLNDREALAERLYLEHPEHYPDLSGIPDEELFAWMERVRQLVMSPER